jgi:hypothetical protein
MIGLGIVSCAESGETFVAEVGLQGIYSLDYHVESEIKLFLINKIRILNVALH